MDPGRFTDSFGLFILRLEPLVSGPDAVWRNRSRRLPISDSG